MIRSIVVLLLFVGAASSDVVINEILYHAPDDLEQLEFVEITNDGNTAVDLGGWKLSGEVKYEFPSGAMIQPNGFLVVAKSNDVLKEFYDVQAFGEFEKSLSNNGGELKLRNSAGRVVDSVKYQDRSPWPLAADGYSASIERVAVAGSSDNVANWAPSMLSNDYDKTPSGTPGAKNSVATNSIPARIRSVTWNHDVLKPNERLSVIVTPADMGEIASAELRYHYVAPGIPGDELVVELKRDGDHFSADLPTGSEQNRLLRFRVVANSKSGGETIHPHPNEVRPAFTAYVGRDFDVAMIPLAQFLFYEQESFASAEQYRKSQEMPASRGGRFGGFRRGFRGRRYGGFEPTPLRPQGNAALIYTDPKTKESEVFDFINVVQRKSGWKARLHKDRHLLGMSTVNFLFEPNQRTVLNEALSYKFYELAGNKSYQHGFMRLAINGKLAGYHVYFEQPNSHFFNRNNINNDGELYKLIWMGNAEMSPRVPQDQRTDRSDITGRYEKKTPRHEGHQNLVKVIESLERADSDEEMWKLINKHIEVDQVMNYLAVNSLVSHWDGFFNNYFVYFDRKGTGKWSMYPWDQDSTWSQRGGLSEELYEMPIYFGAEGATPDGIVKISKEEQDANRSRGGFRRFSPFGFGFRGGFGGGRRGFGWWRPGGDFSRPLLANPMFYDRFKQRLDELTQTVFTKEEFGPRIDALQLELEPEFRLRARMKNEPEDNAVRELKGIIRALHEHLDRRRTFVRKELAKPND